MILLCPPEKSMQFHHPLDPKKIHAEGSMHKDTTYQGSDRQDFCRHGKKKLKKRKKRKQTNKTQTSTGFAHRQPSNKQLPRSRLAMSATLNIPQEKPWERVGINRQHAMQHVQFDDDKIVLFRPFLLSSHLWMEKRAKGCIVKAQ